MAATYVPPRAEVINSILNMRKSGELEHGTGKACTPK